jgi:L-lactate dehydrogenase complex protein LldG
MSEARKQILAALRKQLPQVAPLPELDGPWVKFEDPLAQLGDSVQMVGGQIEGCSIADLADTVGALPCFDSTKKTVSLVDGIEGNTSLENIDDPHDLEDVHLAIVPGHFAVAENGAVWVNDAEIPHRVVLFIAQHVVLVVPIAEVVNNMNEAYARLDFAENHFGVFIAGPSKTADIEQSLVIGAHGARSLHVIFVDQ